MKKSKKTSASETSYLCLKCGSTIHRGRREFYRNRHWESKHQGEDASLARVYIVPTDHEDAKKLLKKAGKGGLNDGQKNTPKDDTEEEQPKSFTSTPSKVAKSSATSSLSKDAQTYIDTRSANDDTHEILDKSLKKAKNTTQKSIEGFLNDTNEEDGTEENSLEKIQSDLNQIKVMLSNLDINTSINERTSVVPRNNAISDGLKTAKCLDDIENEDVCIEISDDCCKVKCQPCYKYIQAHPNTIRYEFFKLFLILANNKRKTL